MKRQIYTLLLSSILSAGCGSVTTKTPAVTIPKEASTLPPTLGELAKGTYQKVAKSPDKMFPAPSGENHRAVDYGKFWWFVEADDQGLKYVTGHKLLPLFVAIVDSNYDGEADLALECLKPEAETPERVLCTFYKLGTAQVLYEKLLRYTPRAMAGRKVTADSEYSTTYTKALPEEIRGMLRDLEQELWGDKKNSARFTTTQTTIF